MPPVPIPPAGTQPSFTEKIAISTSPTQKLGAAWLSAAITRTTWSASLPAMGRGIHAERKGGAENEDQRSQMQLEAGDDARADQIERRVRDRRSSGQS